MDETEDKGPLGKRGTGEDRWTWLSGEPGAQEPAARRGIQESRWTWLGEEPPPRPGGKGRALRMLGIVGVATGSIAVVAALVLLAIEAGDDDGSVTVVHTPPPASTTATEAATSTATATPVATATTAATEAPGTRYELALWNEAGSHWQADDIEFQESGYRAGEAIPFRLRIDGNEGQVYNVSIRYDCAAGEAAGFDYLTDHNNGMAMDPALADDGPGGAVPDAALLIPDDTGTAADDTQDGRSLRMWGGTFEQSPAGPIPPTPCSVSKTLQLRIRPRGETVYLLWGAHLNSLAAGSGVIAFGMQVDIAELEQETERISVVLT